MPKTVETSATSYLSAAEFLKRADARTVGDLCSDNGTRVSVGSLSSDPNLAAALLDASGLLEMSCLRGGRYHPTDLAALTGAGQAALYRLLARMTICCLHERRPDMEMKQPWIVEDVQKQLERIENGETIFSFLETEEVGVPTNRVETSQNVEARNGTTFIAGRLFGRRSNRMRGPWGW